MKGIVDMKKILVALLIFCFIGPERNGSGSTTPVLQTKLTGLKTSLVQLKTKLGDLNKKLVALKDKLESSTPFVLPHQPSIQPVFHEKIEDHGTPAVLRTDLQHSKMHLRLLKMFWEYVNQIL